jgi:hypothetical protein
MAVDLYVGTLTRYYTNQWENVAQKMARERGLKYSTISPQTAKEEAETDPTKVEIALQHWQRNVSEALCGAGGSEVAWQEGLGPPYFTDRIGWEPLFAVMLWAACIELGKAPPSVVPNDMANDPVLMQCLADSAKYQVTAFLNAQFWLPAEFIFFARFPSPAGDEVGVASVDALLFALEKINEQSWRTQEWREWLKDDFSDRTILETPAKYGFALLANMATEAKANRLPMALSF